MVDSLLLNVRPVVMGNDFLKQSRAPLRRDFGCIRHVVATYPDTSETRGSCDRKSQKELPLLLSINSFSLLERWYDAKNRQGENDIGLRPCHLWLTFRTEPFFANGP